MKNLSFRALLSLVFRVTLKYLGFGHHGYRDGSQCRVDRKWANLTPLCEKNLRVRWLHIEESAAWRHPQRRSSRERIPKQPSSDGTHEVC